MIAELSQDLRYGARTMAKAPAFTMIAALALALGIGATAAIFSVAYGILARPLPYPGADRVRWSACDSTRGKALISGP
jgi:hypothetical protein